jgi:hypothetical protein
MFTPGIINIIILGLRIGSLILWILFLGGSVYKYRLYFWRFGGYTVSILIAK